MNNIAAVDLNHHRIPGGLDIDSVHCDHSKECLNVHAWFIDDDKVIVQRRKGDCYGGLYDISVAGHVDADETPEHAIVREALEEGGVDISRRLVPLTKEPLHIYEPGRYKDTEYDHNQLVYVFVAHVSLDELCKTADKDVESFEVWSLDDLEKRALTDAPQGLVPHPKFYYQMAIAALKNEAAHQFAPERQLTKA